MTSPIALIVIASWLATGQAGPRADDGSIEIRVNSSRTAVENAVRSRVLTIRFNLEQATHAGIEKGRTIVDPSAEMLAAIRSTGRDVRVSTDLTSRTVGEKYILVTVGSVEWTGLTKGIVNSYYYSSDGRFSHDENRIVRFLNRCKLTPVRKGCGYWKHIDVSGTNVTADNASRKPRSKE